MNYKNCLTGILLLSMKVCGQDIKPLSIGDKVPAINIKNIFNYPALQSRLSAFNNKLVILDFMASNCISCLKVLPRFDSIQKVYGDKVQIFLVTYEKKDKVMKFLQRYPSLKLPIIGEDTILKKYFPHTFISHEVWIKDGVVKAITHPEYVNTSNIEILLAGNKINWPVKKDLINYDYDQSILDVKEEDIFYSGFTGSINNIIPRFLVKENVASLRTLAVNLTIIQLYLRSYSIYSFNNSHIFLEVKDRTRFVYDSAMYKDEWKIKNSWCYESISPASIAKDMAMEKMRRDLDFYFGVQGRMEKRKIACYVITSDNKPQVIPAGKIKNAVNISIANLLYSLNQNLYGVPVIDKTGYPQTLITVSEASLKNIFQLQIELRDQGMEMHRENRETEVLVITENKSLTHK